MLINADIVTWANTYDGPLFHAVLCDCPYELSNNGLDTTSDRFLRVLTKIVLPNLDQLDTQFFEDIDLRGIPLDGSLLSRRKIAAAVKAGICMPECAVNLQSNVLVGQEEIKTNSIPSGSGIADGVLMNEGNPQGDQFLGDYILDLRDTLDLAARNILGSSFAEYGPGFVSVPIAPVLTAGCCTPLTSALVSYAPGFGEYIGLTHNSLGQPFMTPSILADGGTVNTLMLRFDVRKRTLELNPAHRASQQNASSKLGSPKLIRTDPTTCSLSPELQPHRVSLVLATANGAFSAYFHIWLRSGFWASLSTIVTQNGFMGKQWDGSGVSFQADTWRAIARVLHPGAFLFVFAGTLNDDLISVAMRQAGLRKYHRGASWSYGSGFPKSTNLAAMIDERAFQAWLDEHPDARAILDHHARLVSDARKAKKAQPNDVALQAAYTLALRTLQQRKKEIKTEAGFVQTAGQKRHQPKFAAAELGYREKDNGYNSKERETFDVTAPATDLARTWAGHRYGGQMLKPSFESLLIFQKPYAADTVDSITATGAGALWIEGGRIGTDDDTARIWKDTESAGKKYAHIQQAVHMPGSVSGGSPNGRWPSNLNLCHHPLCEPRGVRTVKGHASDADYTPTGNQGPTSIVTNVKTGAHYGNETIPDWSCHPDCAVRRMGKQSGELQSNDRNGHRNTPKTSGIYGEYENYEERPSRGDSGTAARYFFNGDYMLERLEAADLVIYEAKASSSEREAGLDPRQIKLLRSWCGVEVDGFDEDTINDGRATPIDNPYQRGETTRRNTHATVKPLSLNRHLATLLLPPDVYAPRRLLVPFAGVASEMIGALLAGWDEVVGVELEADHVAIGNARIAYWQQRRWELMNPDREITITAAPTMNGQRDMFDELTEEA